MTEKSYSSPQLPVLLYSLSKKAIALISFHLTGLRVIWVLSVFSTLGSEGRLNTQHKLIIYWSVQLKKYWKRFTLTQLRSAGREKCSPIPPEAVQEHPLSLPCTKVCVSVVQETIRAFLNAPDHFQNITSLLFTQRGGDCGVRISFGVPPGLCAGVIWAWHQFRPLGFSVPSETEINTSWFLTRTMQSFICCIWTALWRCKSLALWFVSICMSC